MPVEEEYEEEYEEENEEVYEEEEAFLDSEQEEAKEEKPEFDDKEYGKNVQKRINKLVSDRKVLEDENLALNGRLSELERKFDNQSVSASGNDIDRRMSELKKKRIEMYEVGDIDPDVEDEWQDLRNEKRNNDYRKQQPQPQPQQQQAKIPRAQQEWLDDNGWYMSEGGARANHANDVYKAMVDEDGYNPEHPGTYRELSNRLKDKREKAPPPASSGMTRRPGKAPKITADDKIMLREMGMNPNDPNNIKEFLKNKKRTA